MAYRVDIEHEFDRAPAVDGFGSHAISFILGYDTVDDTIFFMTIRFTTDGSGIYDLRFGIEERVADKLEWTVGTDYSIECSKKVVPDEYRPVVLGYVLEAIDCIFKACSPSKVTMQSFYSSIPAKALIKYEKICALMTELGMNTSINQPDGTFGKHYWLFERSN